MPQTKTRHFRSRSFRVSSPVVWSSLPEDIRIPELSLERFKSMLKTISVATGGGGLEGQLPPNLGQADPWDLCKTEEFFF